LSDATVVERVDVLRLHLENLVAEQHDLVGLVLLEQLLRLLQERRYVQWRVDLGRLGFLPGLVRRLGRGLSALGGLSLRDGNGDAAVGLRGARKRRHGLLR
jgi:hypothetical protein